MGWREPEGTGKREKRVGEGARWKGDIGDEAICWKQRPMGFRLLLEIFMLRFGLRFPRLWMRRIRIN